MDTDIKSEDHQKHKIPTTKSTKKKSSKRIIAKSIYTLIIIIAIGISGFLYYELKKAKSNPEQDSKKVVEKLSRILVLDAVETPTVARIENSDDLRAKNEEFYRDAKNGDYLVIYTKRAIIFRKTTNQIINFAPIVNDVAQNNTDSQQNNSESTPTQQNINNQP